MRTVSIIGLGLIGGSLGLALRRSGGWQVVGYARRPETARLALTRGAVDRIEPTPQVAARADVVIISTPVMATREVLSLISGHLRPGCIVSDVASTKVQVMKWAQELLPAQVSFVGGHPMAGSHRAGVESAKAELFQRTLCILTPTESTDTDSLNLISGLWQMIGASVKIMSPEEHDFLIAASSHLPHTVACALVQVVLDAKNDRGSAMDFAASGFADMTRIASGSSEIWKAILLDNAENIILMLSSMEAELAEFRAMLEARDSDTLIEKLSHIKKIRDSFKKRLNKFQQSYPNRWFRRFFRFYSSF